MILAINMENLKNAFVIMAQGMIGIFVTILIIMAVIFLIPRVSNLNEKEENSEKWNFTQSLQMLIIYLTPKEYNGF